MILHENLTVCRDFRTPINNLFLKFGIMKNLEPYSYFRFLMYILYSEFIFLSQFILYNLFSLFSSNKRVSISKSTIQSNNEF